MLFISVTFGMGLGGIIYLMTFVFSLEDRGLSYGLGVEHMISFNLLFIY